MLRGIGQRVNLSCRHVLSLTVVDDVSAALSAAGADPSLLTVEVTETVVLSDLGRACEHLAGLRDLGVRVAVDDFGTGHTSLAHLRSEAHTSELQSLMRTSYAVLCLKKKNKQ